MTFRWWMALICTAVLFAASYLVIEGILVIRPARERDDAAWYACAEACRREEAIIRALLASLRDVLDAPKSIP